MDLLLLFAGSGGRVISKDEIIATVWEGRAVGDDTLAGAVSRLRTALGDSANDRYIETLPKRGYRLVRADAKPPAPPAPSRDDLVGRGAAALAAGAPNLAQARLYFLEALKADPGRAEAQAGLAETLLAQHLAGQGAGDLVAAKVAATAAVGLDNRSAAAWSALALATLLVDRDFASAEGALQRALALAPDLAAAHACRAFALAAVGRFAEAEHEARAVVALQPLSLGARGALLQVLSAARRFRPALVEADAMLRLDAHAAEAWYARGWAKVFLGEEAEGVESQLKGLECWGVGPPQIAELRAAFGRSGFAGLCRAAAALFETQQVLFHPRRTDLAILHAGSRDVDAAFAALETAERENDPYLMFLPWLPHFDPLRGDPRLDALVARTRLRP